MVNFSVNGFQKPLVGFIADSTEYAKTVEVLYPANGDNQATGIVAGDPVVINFKGGVGTGGATSAVMADGANPMDMQIAKKATTFDGTADTDMCGILLKSATDIIINGEAPLPNFGDRVNVALIGSGMKIWVEVASQNLASFNGATPLSKLSWDFTNGGIKKDDAGTFPAQLRSAVYDAQKIKVEADGSAKFVDCKAVLIELTKIQ